MRLASLILLLTAVVSFAADGSSLKPPAGASVALIVFEDLECPSCAQASPLLEKAAEYYKVPLVIHDFPLKIHPWAWDAAIAARYIEQKYGRAISGQFRDYIYQYQPQITRDNLRSYAEKFAAAHKFELPFMLDPQGQIAAAIRADQDLGQKVQLGETPTIFVVAANNWTHVTDRSQLYAILGKMKRDVPPAPAPKAPAQKHATRKK